MKKLILSTILLAACASKPTSEQTAISEIASTNATESAPELEKAAAPGQPEDDGTTFRVLTVKGKDVNPEYLQKAEAALATVMAERKDLKIDDNGRSSVEVTLNPLSKEEYIVMLWVRRFQSKGGESASLHTSMQSFKMKPGYNLKPELARKLKILVPPPKHAEPHLGDNISRKELDEGYKRLKDSLHKKKK